MTYPIITIDGPSGAGKGTIAYRLAQVLGFNLLDSGALYRIVGLLAYQRGILTDELLANGQLSNAFEQQLVTLIQDVAIDFVINTDNQAVEILLDGSPLTDDIRTETVGAYASKVATLPLVRTALLTLQQDTAKRCGVVADGRDMGTVVFPNADVKIFLTASSEVRAKRRVKQLQQAGKIAEYQAVLSDIQKRDEQDKNRLIAPLKPADDAVVIDGSLMTIDEVLTQILVICRQRGL